MDSRTFAKNFFSVFLLFLFVLMFSGCGGDVSCDASEVDKGRARLGVDSDVHLWGIYANGGEKTCNFKHSDRSGSICMSLRKSELRSDYEMNALEASEVNTACLTVEKDRIKKRCSKKGDRKGACYFGACVATDDSCNYMGIHESTCLSPDDPNTAGRCESPNEQGKSNCVGNLGLTWIEPRYDGRAIKDDTIFPYDAGDRGGNYKTDDWDQGYCCGAVPTETGPIGLGTDPNGETNITLCVGGDAYSDADSGDVTCEAIFNHLHEGNDSYISVDQETQNPSSASQLPNWVGPSGDGRCCGTSFDDSGSIFFDESYQRNYVCSTSEDGKYGWVNSENPETGVYRVGHDDDYWTHGYDNDHKNVDEVDDFNYLVATDGEGAIIACDPDEEFKHLDKYGQGCDSDGVFCLGENEIVNVGNKGFFCGKGSKLIKSDNGYDAVPVPELANKVMGICNLEDHSGVEEDSVEVAPGEYVTSKGELPYYCTETAGFVHHDDMSDL